MNNFDGIVFIERKEMAPIFIQNLYPLLSVYRGAVCQYIHRTGNNL